MPLWGVLDAKLLNQTESVHDKIEKVREYLFQSKEFAFAVSKGAAIQRRFAAKIRKCLRFSNDTGRLAETIVFLEIRRRNLEVYYWKSRDGYEVDFVVKAGQKLTELIQVAWDVRVEAATQRREERALWCAMGELDVDSGIILTEDHERILKENGKTIRYMPIWKWLLVPARDET